MASSGFQLFLFCLVMFFGSYFAGSAPLMFSMSEEKLQRVSVLGAGLLVGTALAIIIPEGVQTLLKSYTTAVAPLVTEGARQSETHGDVAAGEHQHHHDHQKGGHDMEGLDKAIGVSLVLGFLFMMLIDQLASSNPSKSDLESGTSPVSPSASSLSLNSSRSGRSGSVSWTATLGLVVHAAADGIALGAAATTHQTDVEVIVFLAIMLHKAPAAFGLSTFLLHEGLERVRVKRHLLVFSLSAPTLALGTFVSLHGGRAQMDTLHATGIAMLFSAGTFLYVATVHVLPEVTSGGKGGGGGGGHSHGASFSKCDLVLLVVGALAPLLLTLGHHH